MALTRPQARELWAKTLETTQRPQGTGQLANDQARCCLGVACDLAVVHGVIEDYRDTDGHAPSIVSEWLGITGDQEKYVLMNDNEGKKFAEIAAEVRKQPLTSREARELWADTLATTEVPQARAQLASGDARCCLGVACDLAVEHGVIESYDPTAMFAPEPVREWIGLTVDKAWGNDPSAQSYYSNLNDGKRWSFKQIADEVRKTL